MISDNPIKNTISAASATAVAEFLTLPICTIKTNYQNTMDLKQKVPMGVVVRDIYNRGGVRAFYKASFPAILGQMFSTTSKYVLYRYLDTSPDYPIKNKFLNGMTAGFISSLATHPLDVARVHLQMAKTMPSLGLLYYRGYSKTITKIAISSSLFFPLYDTFRKEISNPLLSAMASAVVATVCMHPIDYLKTRHMAGLPLYNGINPITYYRGLTLNLMRIVPHFMITMGLIELFHI
jgi:hypothetical protein